MPLSIGKGKNGQRPMARRPRGHEKIYVDKKRFGYFPQRFIWRGRRYEVEAVERCWTVSRKRLGNQVDRLCFRVRCAAANGHRGGDRERDLDLPQRGSSSSFDLYQDLNTNTWHLEKVIA